MRSPTDHVPLCLLSTYFFRNTPYPPCPIENAHCSSCERSFSETSQTPIAHLKTPIAIVVQVLSALTEGVGINAATRLYGVSKNSIYRWQERLSGLKKPCCCLREPTSFCNSALKGMSCIRKSRRTLLRTSHKAGRLS